MLTETAIKALKPKDKQYKKADERGLYLLVTPSGSKLWRFKYRINGREKTLSIGMYPDIKLKKARDRRDEARSLLADGGDPSALKQQQKIKRDHTFNSLVDEFLEAVDKGLIPKTKWSESSRKDRVSRIDNDLRPWLGNMPMDEITKDDLDRCLMRIADRGALETARRCKQLFGKIARFGISNNYCERDVSADLRDKYPKQEAKHHSAITNPDEVGALMSVISDYQGSNIVRIALKFSAYTFQRAGEIRHAEWSEIDLKGKLWRLPASKMKMKREHLVPLSKQVIKLLEEIKPFTGESKFIFPSERSNSRPMSENTVNAAIRRLGYTKEEMTAHGFRATASTLLNEMEGIEPDWIEVQLAHGEQDSSRKPYNRAKYLQERKRMMQKWSDYLDGLAK